jgi:uncharacterized protein (DUF58 family)
VAAPERAFSPALKAEAGHLAARLPALVIEAKMVARSVRFGVHGRRRAGLGENFWQFRPFLSGEAAARIDWRRSARESRAYVREREWEAAQTLWIWIDRSPSMDFSSKLANASKIDRAIVLALALADITVRGGERVGLLGLTSPIAARDVIERFAQVLAGPLASHRAHDDAPPNEPIAARSKLALIGDFLAEPERLDAAFRALGAEGAGGVAAMIADPIEETFPFRGAVDFVTLAKQARLRSLRAEDLREPSLARLELQRERLRATCKALGWSFSLHRTDASPAAALLSLSAGLSAYGAS